jgi:hypothetical protein
MRLGIFRLQWSPRGTGPNHVTVLKPVAILAALPATAAMRVEPIHVPMPADDLFQHAFCSCVNAAKTQEVVSGRPVTRLVMGEKKGASARI